MNLFKDTNAFFSLLCLPLNTLHLKILGSVFIKTEPRISHLFALQFNLCHKFQVSSILHNLINPLIFSFNA